MKKNINAKTSIERAIEAAGGIQALADLLGITYGAVWQWRAGHTVPTPERAVAIEKALKSRVTRYDLRPDVFDV